MVHFVVGCNGMIVAKETEAHGSVALDLEVGGKRTNNRERHTAIGLELSRIHNAILAEPIPQVLVDRLAAKLVE
jgi:hypothetical protein